jgi:hypothetical protein
MLIMIWEVGAMASVVSVPDKFAVMAVDPGGTTGVATGIFDSKATVAETLTSGDVVIRRGGSAINSRVMRSATGQLCD